MERSSSSRTAPVRSSAELSGSGGSPSPYLTARNLRANHYLDLARALTNYRLLALVLLVLNAALAATVVWQARQTRIVPYVVERDGFGNSVAFGPAERLEDPDRALLVHEIARWVWNVRTISLDPGIQRRLILDAYAYTDGRAVTLLNRFYRESTPFVRGRTATVSVQVTSVLELPEAEGSWQVQWVERELAPGGTEREVQRWQALLKVEVDPPARVEEVITNPVGIYVEDFDWTRLPDSSNDTPNGGS